MFSPEELQKAYGRPVPLRVRLGDEFDVADHLENHPGDIVHVVPPPAGLEVDEVSLFVQLLAKGGNAPITERVYDHELSPTAVDVP